MHTARKTIAVVIAQVDPLGGGPEAELRAGVLRACRQHDVNLLLVAARALRGSGADRQRWQGASDLLHPEAVDGVVLMSGGLAGICTPAELAAICSAYAPLPVCSAGMEVPGVPSVVVDRRAAVVALFEHLISAHGRSRTALSISSEDDAQSRSNLELYREVLARHGIALDPALVVAGDPTAEGARRSVERLIESGVRFDALCASDDVAAAGAAIALRSLRGGTGDLPSLAALGDSGRAHLGFPPLTAIQEPRRDLAELAVRLLLHQLEGREVPPCTSLPARLVLRRSCGCAPSRRRVFDMPAQLSLAEWLQHNERRLASSIAQSTRLSERDPEAPALLLAALGRVIAGERGALAAAIEYIGSRSGHPVEHHEELQKAVSLLRNELSAFASPSLDELWDDTRQAIAFSSTRRYAERLLDIDSIYRRLSATAERFASTFDLSELRTCVAAALREFGIADALLCLYTDDSEEQLAPFLCLMGGQVTAPAQVAYPARQLLPDGFISAKARQVLHVSTLRADARPLGIAVFAHRPGLRVFDMLSAQIGGAIQTVRLHRRIVQQTTLHERTLQERRAAAERMDSLRALAGGVAHDLNNALGPLLVLPSLALSELSEGDAGAGSEQLQADLSAIRAAAVRASQTIRDLLTLARQGHTERQPLDLNRALEGWLSSVSIGSAVVLRSTLAEQPLVIEASEAHLIRALSNLVQNAVEAMDGEGIVRVETRSERLRAAHVGHEVIPPGHYAVVSVRDSGKGISRALRRRLFEPFVSSKRLSGRSGSGLGLAVVHGVVKEHGGFIDVDSARGRGTTFTLYFPISHEPPKAAPPLSAPPPSGQGRILVVDDDPVQLRTTRRVLEHLGYEVTTLSSGEAAYELLSSSAPEASEGAFAASPFDLLVIDRLLGEAEDGLDLLARVHRLFPTQKALMASGEAPDERASAAIEQGLGWLAKPYTVNALARAVSGLLEESTVGFSAPVLKAPASLQEDYRSEDVHHSFTAMLSRARESLVPSKDEGSAGGSRRRRRVY